MEEASTYLKTVSQHCNNSGMKGWTTVLCIILMIFFLIMFADVLFSKKEK